LNKYIKMLFQVPLMLAVGALAITARAEEKQEIHDTDVASARVESCGG
jgi:hypothetical protein